MKDKRTLEQDYKNLKRMETPDLWNRIRENLQEHPERSQNRPYEAMEDMLPAPGSRPPYRYGSRSEDTSADSRSPYRYGSRSQDASLPPRGPWHSLSPFPSARAIRGMAAAAAAVLVLTVLIPWHDFNPFPRSFDTTESTMSMQAETTAETRDIVSEDPANSKAPFPPPADGEKASSSGSGPREEAQESQTSPGILTALPADSAALSYRQLALVPYEPLPIPAHARTMPEDAMYFSEDILGDTELLCQATIINVRLDTDSNGTAVNVSYDVSLDQVYYSQDYVTEKGRIVVNAPIIEASSDSGAAGHVLYQMQTGASYLLPLKKQNGNWELLCASAPQVQITGDGAYLFHSGYTTLADSRSRIVIGNQESANDYYYDRMLLRDDDDFLSDFIMLTKR